MNTFNKHQLVQNCLLLPIDIDAERMLKEYQSIPPQPEDSRRAPVHRDASALFLKGYPPVMGIAEDDDRDALKFTPYIKEVIYEKLSGRPGKALIATLKPGGRIYPHVDRSNDYFLNTARIHIPIYTNDQVRFLLDNKFYKFKAGEVWTVNNLIRHAVVNDDPTEPRVHLIVDIYPDDKTFEFIHGAIKPVGESNDALIQELESAQLA